MENSKTNILAENKASEKNAKDLTELATKNGYKSVRFFVSPDKKVSAETVVEDAKAFFMALGNNNESELLFSIK